MFQYEAKVLRVVDGDTLHLDIDLGFHVHIEGTIRLARIDAPNKVNFTTQGLREPAMDYINLNCPVGSVCVVEISRAEKYGRWLAELLYLPGVTDRYEILKNPRVLNDELLKQGLAKVYKA